MDAQNHQNASSVFSEDINEIETKSEVHIYEHSNKSKDQREARRRKILSRGVDRLSYITGSYPSLDHRQDAAINDLVGNESIQSHTNLTPNSSSNDPSVIPLQPRREIFSVALNESPLTPGLEAIFASMVDDSSFTTLPSPLPDAFKPKSNMVKKIQSAISSTSILRACFICLLALFFSFYFYLERCNIQLKLQFVRSIASWPLILIPVTDFSVIISAVFWKMLFGFNLSEPMSNVGNDLGLLTSFLDKLGWVIDLGSIFNAIVQSLVLNTSLFLFLVGCILPRDDYDLLGFCSRLDQFFEFYNLV